MTAKERKEIFEDEKKWYCVDTALSGIVRVERLMIRLKNPCNIYRIVVKEHVLDWERTYKDGQKRFQEQYVTKIYYHAIAQGVAERYYEPVSKTQALEVMKEADK